MLIDITQLWSIQEERLENAEAQREAIFLKAFSLCAKRIGIALNPKGKRGRSILALSLLFPFGFIQVPFGAG